MGLYKAAILTNGGNNMILQALSGNTLYFTAVKTSSYSYPPNTDIAGLTDLEDIEQTVLPSSAEILESSFFQIGSRFDNSQVEEEYLIQNIGVYAKVGEGTETLFAVVQAVTADQMPAQSEVSQTSYIYDIQIFVDNADKISVTVDPAGTVRVQDLLDFENAIKRVILASLPASGWSASAPYTQSAAAAGIKADDTPIVAPYFPEGTTAEEEKAIQKAAACITYIDTGNGSVTVTCVGKKPEADFTIAIKGV